MPEASMKNPEFRKRILHIREEGALEKTQEVIEEVSVIPESAWLEEILPLIDQLNGTRNVKEFLEILSKIQKTVEESKSFWKEHGEPIQ